MNVDIRHVSEAIVIRPDGPRLDAVSAPAFRQAVVPKVSGLHRVVVDLSAVKTMDSTGLGALISVLKVLAPGASLGLFSVSPEVGALLKLTRLDRVLRTFDSLDAALAA